MPIEFHCEHCNKLIKAPDSAGGKNGRCPFCQGATYVPLPAADDELPLAPLDDSDEKHRRQLALEDAAAQYKLLKERSLPGEIGGRRSDRPIRPADPNARGPAPAARSSPDRISEKDVNLLIVGYIEAMSHGQLDRAARIASQLSAHRITLFSTLDEMLGKSDLSPYGLPTLPRPVLMGFIKQLREQV